MARGLKFRILEVEELYCLIMWRNIGVDQLDSNSTADLRPLFSHIYAKSRFSHYIASLRL